MTSVAKLLHHGAAQLLTVSDTPRLDAEVLLTHVTGLSRTYFRGWPERELPPEHVAEFQQLLDQRLTGHPIAHLIGTREFWSREFVVTPDVLIPRPETELLIEWVLRLIPKDQAAQIADLGTGSGAIAVSLALELPRSVITALDLSSAALQIAAENAARLGAKNIRFIQSDWFDALPCHETYYRNPEEAKRNPGNAAYFPRITPEASSGLLPETFDLIVSNPPYIAEHDPHLNSGDVRFEPKLALTSGTDGLDAIRRIVQAAPSRLKPGGWLLFEHGYDQADRAGELLRTAGFVELESFVDLQGHYRVSGGRKA